MKVFFDHQCYWEKYGGVSRYFTEILKAHLHDGEYELAIKYSNNEYLKELNVPYKNCFENINIPKKHYLISAINKPYSIRAVKKTTANIIHLTHYDPYLFSSIKNKIVVSTIHDLNYFAIPQFFHSTTNILKNWQIQCVDKSDYIITISENSKKDLIRYLNVNENKIQVIYHGLNPNFKKTNENRLFQKPYILFVGRRSGYKNFKTVVNSFAQIKSEDLFLVCTGAQFSKYEVDMFNSLGVEKRVINITATEKDLVNLYSNAIFFVFPSLYEGFGFPLLEAMGCECPVLCSNTSCFPEIAGDAAIYFNPNSINDCTEKMVELLNCSTLSRELRLEGLKQIRKFSWDVSRMKHYELYQGLEELL